MSFNYSSVSIDSLNIFLKKVQSIDDRETYIASAAVLSNFKYFLHLYAYEH